MARERLVVFGEVLFDCFDDGSRVLGGAPFNVAWHLAHFGLDPLLVSRVGADDAGKAVLAALREAGMRTHGVGVDADHATGEVTVTLTDGQPAFEIVDDRAWDHVEPPTDFVPGADLVYHGTLALRHCLCRRNLDLIVGRPPAPVFLDVNLRRPWWRADTVRQLIDRARWLKINDVELALLAPGGGSTADMASIMLERHRLDRIIVTCGARGAFTLGTGGDVVEACPESEAPVADTVGAGDAFAAVCIAGIINGWPWPVTMTRAQEFATELVRRRGAIIADRATYREFLADWN